MDIVPSFIAEKEYAEKCLTTDNSYDKSMCETKAGNIAEKLEMKPAMPVINTNNIVAGIRGKTIIFTGSAISDTTPENLIMSGSVKI